MAFLDELPQKAKDVATLATDKVKDAAELLKINVAIVGEQKEIDRNYRILGEWFVTEYEGEIPDAARELVEAINISKTKIAELESSKPAKEYSETTTQASPEKACPICGAFSDSKFCPSCGAPMGE